MEVFLAPNGGIPRRHGGRWRPHTHCHAPRGLGKPKRSHQPACDGYARCGVDTTGLWPMIFFVLIGHDRDSSCTSTTRISTVPPTGCVLSALCTYIILYILLRVSWVNVTPVACQRVRTVLNRRQSAEDVFQPPFHSSHLTELPSRLPEILPGARLSSILG
jgi:hypothetical protein